MATRAEKGKPQQVPLSDAPRYPGPGFKLGEYTLIELLGQGSMASVYLARDHTGHDVAIKIIQEGPGVSATMLERFRREAEASKKLRRHPHIMKVYTTGQEGPYHYIVMESVRQSRTWRDLIVPGGMDIPTAVHIGIKMARALQYAHLQRIIHRDVKPTNVLINEFGEPLLGDFGVVELVDLPSCTLTGALTGTPLYMSPEQAHAERVGSASDIYSLGVVLFEALTGELPFALPHNTPVRRVIAAVKAGQSIRPRSLRKEISVELEAVVLKALEKDPRDRYADAEAFAVDLERALAGKPVSAHRFSPFDHVRHLARRYHNAVWITISLALLLAIAGNSFRNKLMEARYENLLQTMKLRGLEYALEQQEESQEPGGSAWNASFALKRARNLIAGGNWEEALGQLQTAADLSRETGDTRTAAIAQLEAARCHFVLKQAAEAATLYRAVLNNPDTPRSLADMAQAEALALASLFKDDAAAEEILTLRPLPPPGEALRDAADCMRGQRPPQPLHEHFRAYPDRLQNDVLLAVAIGWLRAGQKPEALVVLRRCAYESHPAGEWPGPLARRLAEELDE